MRGKTALIAGASGLIGNELLHCLLEGEEYEQVIAIVRTPLQLTHAKLRERLVNYDKLQDERDSFAVDDVFCCLGTTIKKAKTKEAMHMVDVEYPLAIAQLASEKGAKQFLLVSALGADPDSSVWYSRMKGMLEQELKNIPYESISILRPSLLQGHRLEFRFGERASGILLSALSFLLVGPLRKYRAIKGRTVASAMYRIAQMDTKGITIYPSDKIASIAFSL